jgi:NAD(P)H-dependent FMN reductase
MNKILAISGSLRSISSNTTILKYLQKITPTDVEFEIYDELGALPHFNPDIDNELSPEVVTRFRSKLKEANGVIICTPEYAFGVPGVLKNGLDWIVSSGEFTDKPTATISASPLATGGDKAHASLLVTIKVMGAKLVENGSVTVPIVLKKFDAEGNIIEEQTAREFEMMMNSLISAF